MTVLQVPLASLIQVGQALLEKEPPSLECRKLIDNNDGEPIEEWSECTKSHICEKGIGRSDWRAVESEHEYINNWVE